MPGQSQLIVDSDLFGCISVRGFCVLIYVLDVVGPFRQTSTPPIATRILGSSEAGKCGDDLRSHGFEALSLGDGRCSKERKIPNMSINEEALVSAMDMMHLIFVLLILLYDDFVCVCVCQWMTLNSRYTLGYCFLQCAMYMMYMWTCLVFSTLYEFFHF